jgi:hypothetical protein
MARKVKRVVSRPDRWRAAVADAQDALNRMAEIADGDLSSALDTLRELKDEYENWKDSLPENLANSATADKLSAIVDLDLDVDYADAIAEITSAIDNAEGVDLPLGFGRD